MSKFTVTHFSSLMKATLSLGWTLICREGGMIHVCMSNELTFMPQWLRWLTFHLPWYEEGISRLMNGSDSQNSTACKVIKGKTTQNIYLSGRLRICSNFTPKPGHVLIFNLLVTGRYGSKSSSNSALKSCMCLLISPRKTLKSSWLYVRQSTRLIYSYAIWFYRGAILTLSHVSWPSLPCWTLVRPHTSSKSIGKERRNIAVSRKNPNRLKPTEWNSRFE